MFAEKYKQFNALVRPTGTDYDWLEQQYQGKSVAVLEGEVIAFSDDPFLLWKEVREEYPYIKGINVLLVFEDGLALI